ncbi:MAG TPA: hypothetical protein VJ843_05245, partial [Candidatus Saccharimonadales bacterium]|nr:hypothetical protein [Candidatus Saccharimonadales bacterium]
ALVAVRVATRGDGDSRRPLLKVDRDCQLICLSRLFRSAVITSAAPNARVQRGRERPHQYP